MSRRIAFEPVNTWVHGTQEARLVFIDGKLGVVVVRLGDGYGDLAQSWHAEAAFNGFERISETTFPDLDAVEKWIAWHIAATR
jgi:hypothetical protein